MQPLWFTILGYRLQLEICIQECTEIADDLFFMRLELEAGEFPTLASMPPPCSTFDPMRTIGKYGDDYPSPITFASYEESIASI